MKRLLLCAIAVVLSCGYGFLDARPSKQEFNQTMHQELHDVIGRIEKVVRAGTSIDASQVIADAILQCLYNSIKIDLAAILPKACTIESSIDGILFTIVDSVDNAVPSLSFTICDKLEPLQPAIGFTVCDEVSFVQEELSFTIVDGLTNLNASLGFTVCDTIANSCQEVKFTVVDKITNMVASLGFTICDAFANALPDTDSVAGIVINKVHAVQESIAFTICQKIEVVEGDAASALDKACSILDQLPLDPIDIEPIKFTVCDKAETLCSKIDILAQCFPTPITQADFDSNDGKLTLASGVPSTLQSYCLAEDIIGDSFTENEAVLTLQDDDITVDLNCHKINGRIIIVGDRCVVKNGFICSPEPDAANSTPDDAAIEIVGDKVQVLNCVIQNADTTITPGLAGRIGILASGANNAKIAHCCIKAGNGADSETTAGNGGRGIRFSGCVKCRVIDCEVQSGDGGQGTGVGTPDGGDGGDGICIDSSEGNCIINCVIMSGKGGYATSMSTGGNGGHGILLQDNAADNIIQGCSIKLTGVGGMAEEPGNGGDGIRIANDGVIGTKIFGNTIAHTGAGGTSTIANPDGAGGRAINDLISLVLTVSGATAAFDNFAYDIADTLVRYNIHNTGTESGQDLAMPADNLANVFVP